VLRHHFTTLMVMLGTVALTGYLYVVIPKGFDWRSPSAFAATKARTTSRCAVKPSFLLAFTSPDCAASPNILRFNQSDTIRPGSCWPKKQRVFQIPQAIKKRSYIRFATSFPRGGRPYACSSQ
jgi:hypothetical protein